MSPSSSATVSSVWPAIVPTVIGTPSRAAARAVASSPSGWTIVWTPTGASARGAGQSDPNGEIVRSRSATSRSIRGTIRQESKARRLDSSVSPVPADPNT